MSCVKFTDKEIVRLWYSTHSTKELAARYHTTEKNIERNFARARRSKKVPDFVRNADRDWNDKNPFLNKEVTRIPHKDPLLNRLRDKANKYASSISRIEDEL